MLSEESHLSDQELLLAVDGELPPRDAARVQSHLAACWACRSRNQEIVAENIANVATPGYRRQGI